MPKEMIFALLILAVNFLAGLVARPRIAVIVLVASSLSTIFLWIEAPLQKPDESLTVLLLDLAADPVFPIVFMAIACGIGTVGYLLGRLGLFLTHLAKSKLLGRSER